MPFGNQKLDLILEPKVRFNICAKNYILRNESKIRLNIGVKKLDLIFVLKIIFCEMT